MIDKLFLEELGERAIFADLDVLSAHYIPAELPHRKGEIKRIIKIIAPLLRGEKPSNIFVYGKTGTGKTSVVRHVTREMLALAGDPDKNRHGARVACVYMNCRMGYNTKYQVLLNILEDESLNALDLKKKPLDGRRTGKLAGASPTELTQRLRAVVEANNLNLLVVLDEVDMIKGDDLSDLLYILPRLNDEVSAGRVCIVGISNRYAFKDSLDPRSKSTLCGEELVFKPYNADQLTTILAHRVKAGFKKGSISQSNIALIAAFGAQVNGDARYALKLLVKSGELAQEAGRKRVKTEDVKLARERVEEDITKEVVSTLPEHQQIVLYAIADQLARGSQYKRLGDAPGNVLFSGEVYESYERLCKALGSKGRTMRWFREYLNDLEMLGLITLQSSGKGVRGNTSLIRLGNPPEEVKKIVSESLGLE